MPYLDYIQYIITHVPWVHWAVIGIISLFMAGYLWAAKKVSLYGASALCATIFLGLLLIETAVIVRYCGVTTHATGLNFRLAINRLFKGNIYSRGEIISNIIVFVPFGLFLSLFISETRMISAYHQIKLVAIVSLGLSLCIECFQLMLHIGFFELTDLVMNTVGGAVGAGIPFIIRRFLHSASRGRNDKREISSLPSDGNKDAHND